MSERANISKTSFSNSQCERVSKVIPVFVYGSMEDGTTFQELAQTVVVDVGGGIIELESPVANGLRLLAVNENTIEEAECSVVHTQGSHNGKAEVRIAFDKPTPSFWGINFLSEEWSPAQDRCSELERLKDGSHPVTPEMYRKLMGRTY
jgi:hypothetical protein